ncbi:ddb1 and cul4 associated factor 7 [Apophysomyces sp. BC1034]|nr:ddb1 and cul4 associated factor 7 [Apophysomyces sp. BC1015]KAG0178411.1 ddb1 and cul4 associated factor 7 [Apophysomyces sp. BC1021]KAG0188819.1 ddb1 and cul4 associated factor 7 [Apophysomyces sp. BC1034]
MPPPIQNVDSHNGGHISHEKEIYQYDAPWPIYAMDWSKVPTEKEGFRLALQVITRTDLMFNEPNRRTAQPDFMPLAEVDSHYPITKVLWEPRRSSRNSDILVTSSDVLRLWELMDNPGYGRHNSNTIGSRHSSEPYSQSLVKRSELVNVKQSDFCAPLTSFDWNEVDPSLVVTASIDTTCTVWNIETCQAKTQLIAHDRDVYDVAFRHGTADVFASVGADGSVRLFDLRALEHSTIVYEAPPAPTNHGQFASVISDGSPPLLRLQFNRINHDLLATFHMDSDTVQILDIRYPGVPVAELTKSHQSNVNCFSWSPSHPEHICTGGDDAQVLVWDIHQKTPTNARHRTHPRNRPQNLIQGPALRYVAESEINALSWSQSLPMWISIGLGRTVQTLRV